MDIFTAPKRAKDQSIKKPLNYPQAEVTEKRLQEVNQKELQQFNNFLRNLYIKLDFKVNKCKHNCIAKANSYRQIADCEQKCGEGTFNFSNYVDSRVSEMQQLLGQCVSNANTLHNAMDQIYYCYEMYNNGFKKLKEFIAEESMFYQ